MKSFTTIDHEIAVCRVFVFEALSYTKGIITFAYLTD
jgi:hypothetical protein